MLGRQSRLGRPVGLLAGRHQHPAREEACTRPIQSCDREAIGRETMHRRGRFGGGLGDLYFAASHRVAVLRVGTRRAATLRCAGNLDLRARDPSDREYHRGCQGQRCGTPNHQPEAYSGGLLLASLSRPSCDHPRMPPECAVPSRVVCAAQSFERFANDQRDQYQCCRRVGPPPAECGIGRQSHQGGGREPCACDRLVGV
jgi:hypothetical protein